ncbi:hypothetical protein JCM8547_009195 [Rhodosporidiobolus lusitaniae]
MRSRSRSLCDAALRHPARAILVTAFLLRLTTSLVVVVAGLVLPTWDAEVTVLAPSYAQELSPYLSPFVRWDAVHFAHVALRGYGVEERTAAFMPGLPLGVMRGGGKVLAWMGGREKVGVNEVVLAGLLGSAAATAGAAVVLHRLTLRLFPHAPPAFALLNSLLFLLAPSRPTIHAAPYTEPFSAFFTFLGMYLFSSPIRGLATEAAAAVAWGVGGLFRAQGAVLGPGFFGWRYMLQPLRDHTRLSISKILSFIALFAILTSISISPFLAFERYIYRLYCSSSSVAILEQGMGRRPWCDSALGLSYGWIQREYWDIGLFKYWRPLQLPNFLLAAPVLALAFSASHTFYSSNHSAVLSSTFPFLFPSPSSQSPSASFSPASSSIPSRLRPFSSPPSPAHASTLTPFVHLSTALSLLLLTTAHVQIALRVCVTDPVVWWWAAELLWRDLGGEERSMVLTGQEKAAKGEKEKKGERRGRRRGLLWLKYCAVWGTVATVLYAVFLPPA